MTYRILVPLDGSTFAESAIPVAADIARRTSGAVRLTRVHVPLVPLVAVGDLTAPIYDPAWDEQRRAATGDYLANVAARYRSALGTAITTVVHDNPSIAEQIETDAAEFDADLIVMTTHGHGGKSLAWFGSIADGVLRHTRRLTLVIPEHTDAPFAARKFLVCLDGSRAAEATMHAAAKLAAVYGAELALVQVVAPPLSGDVLRALSSQGLDRFGVDIVVQAAKTALDDAANNIRVPGRTVSTVVLVNSNAARALIDHIKETAPDVIAMGTHGRGLSRLFIGSVVDKVMRASGKITLVQRIAEDVAS